MKKPRFMDVDFDKESWPWIYYFRVTALYDPMWINITIDPGHYYALQRANWSFSSVNPNVPGVYANPLQVSAFIESGNKWLQLNPFDIALVSSPADSGVLVDMTNAARPMTAKPLNLSDSQNVLARFRDVLTLRISGFTVIASPPNADFSLPSHIDLALIGRLYPVKENELAGGGQT